MRKFLLLAALLLSQSVMAAIVAPLPFTIVAGTPIQANPLQSNFNWLMNQTNANAAPTASPVFTGTVVIPTLNVTGSASIPSLSAPTLNTTTLTVATTASIPQITGGTTFTGTITTTVPGSAFIYDTAVAGRFFRFNTSGLIRWQVGTNATAEGGGNSGSDYIFARYNDAGTLIDTPLTITRSSGVTTFIASPVAPTPATAFVKNQSYVATTGAQNITGVKTFTAGNEPVATNTAKAWAYFNGTTTGTNAPIKGYNVTSVTRTGIGTYTVNFTNALADGNYSLTGTCGYSLNDGVWLNLDRQGFASPQTTTLVHVETSVNGGRVDPEIVSIHIFD
jgi:hypothetical protein